MAFRTRISLTIVVAGALCAVSAAPRALAPRQDKPASGDAPAQSRPHSVWDGAYRDEQAKRGEPLYRQKCASCHGDKLTGGESAPPLAGGQFLSNWNGLTLDVLFERIRITMPSDNPARVGRVPKADILAYILSVNGFPAGSADLQTRAELLKDILIDANKPSGGARNQHGQK